MNTLAEQRAIFREAAMRFAYYYLVYTETRSTDPSKILEELPNLKISFKYFSNADGAYDRNLIRLIHAMKPALDQSGYWGDLVPLLEEGQKACERVGDNAERVKFMTILAQMHINEWDYESAILWARKALNLAEQTNNVIALPEAHLRLGWVYMYVAEYDKALEHLKQSETLSRQTSQWELLASALHLLAKVNAEKGDSKQALKYFRAELQLSPEANSPGAWAFVWLRGAHYMLEVGKTKVAKRLMLRSMRIFETVGNTGGIGHALRGLARIDLVEGNADEALSRLTESLRLIGYRKGEVNVRQDMAEVYRVMGRFEEADQILDVVIQQRQASGERRDLAEAFYLKGRGCESLGRLEQALEMYQRSLGLFEAIGCLPSITDRPRLAIQRLQGNA